jgi:hypothetical protein
VNPCAAVFNRDGRKKLVLTAFFAALLGGTGAFGAEATVSSNRFLFVIDTSASMKPFENAVRESMFDLIYSGIRGHMTNGDTYGVWLVGEENNTAFKIETWRQKYTVEMAARAAAHVKDHGFKGKANLTQAFADAANVIKSVEDLTVVLISNGSNPISGTPFDEAINLRFRELAASMIKSKTTLNTTLVARDGRFVAWAMNSPDFLIEVPQVPIRPKRAKPPVASTSTNAPTLLAKAAAAAPTPLPAAARVVSAPIIITKETVAQERRTFLAMTSIGTNEPAATPSPTNSAAVTPLATNAVATATVTNGSETKAAMGNASAMPQQAVTMPITNTVALAKGETAQVASTIQSGISGAASVTPAPVEALPGTRGIPGLLFVGLGAGAAFTCVLLVLFICYYRRQGPSLISQSLARDRVD